MYAFVKSTYFLLTYFLFLYNIQLGKVSRNFFPFTILSFFSLSHSFLHDHLELISQFLIWHQKTGDKKYDTPIPLVYHIHIIQKWRYILSQKHSAKIHTYLSMLGYLWVLFHFSTARKIYTFPEVLKTFEKRCRSQIKKYSKLGYDFRLRIKCRCSLTQARKFLVVFLYSQMYK